MKTISGCAINGGIEERDGKLYATQSAGTEQRAAI